MKPDIIALCHSGPTTKPDDAQHILEGAAHAAGSPGASSMERLPIEVASTEND